MDIKGLDMLQISKIMELYLNEYFTERVVISDTNGIFSEVIRLAFDEIDHLISVEQMQSFQRDEWFNGASGFVKVSNNNDNTTESYTVMLLMDEHQTKALCLYVSKCNATTCEYMDILVKDFMQNNT